MNYIKIKLEDGYERIPYEERDDGWYVNSERIDGQKGFRAYAHSGAKEMDVRQLLKKECDIRY